MKKLIPIAIIAALPLAALAAPISGRAEDGFFSAPTKPDEKRCVVVITYPSKRPDLAVIDTAPKGKCGPAIDAAVATALAKFLTEQIGVASDDAAQVDGPRSR